MTPIIKLHPAKSDFDIKSIIREIDSSIPIYQNQNIVDLIERCDAMISFSYSTALMDAMILEKPTMLVLIDNQRFDEEELVKKNATLCISSIEDLDTSVEKLLFDEKVRNQLIKNGTLFVNDYLVNQGTASGALSKILLEY